MAGCHVTTSLCVAAMARGAARCNSDVYVSCDSAPAIFLQISGSSAEHSRDCKRAYASKRVFSEFFWLELRERLAVSSSKNSSAYCSCRNSADLPASKRSVINHQCNGFTAEVTGARRRSLRR